MVGFLLSFAESSKHSAICGLLDVPLSPGRSRAPSALENQCSLLVSLGVPAPTRVAPCCRRLTILFHRWFFPKADNVTSHSMASSLAAGMIFVAGVSLLALRRKNQAARNAEQAPLLDHQHSPAMAC